MKSFWVILTLLLIYNSSFSQNFQCISQNNTRLFSNNNGTLRGIRIDSVKGTSEEQILYPFKTARGDYHISKKDTLRPGGSWLGEVVTILSDGTHYFTTHRGDTVVINALASLNDLWRFYDDTSDNYYEAVVTAVDTMTVLGTIDTIKKIRIVSRITGGMLNTSDPLNGMEIIISKNNGFVRVIDLYMFPMQMVKQTIDSGFDYYSYLIYYTNQFSLGNYTFDLIDFYNPTLLEVYNYDVGDEWQYTGPAYYAHDKVIAKNIISSSEVQYVYRRQTTKLNTPTYNDTLIATTDLLVNLDKMPEEWGQVYHIQYWPENPYDCKDEKEYVQTEQFVHFNGNTATYDTSLRKCLTVQHKIAVGKTRYYDCNIPYVVSGNSLRMTFHLISGDSCGNRRNLSIEKNILPEINAMVYPNPVKAGKLKVKFNTILSADLKITDLTGKELYSKQIESEEESIDVTNYPNGIYLLRIVTNDGLQHNKKIIIQH